MAAVCPFKIRWLKKFPVLITLLGNKAKPFKPQAVIHLTIHTQRNLQNLLLRRITAYIIDCTILFFVLAPIGFAVQYIFDFHPDSAKEIYFSILINFSIPVWTYFIYADYSKNGASLGKQFLGVKTTSCDGIGVTLKQACARTAIKMLPWELSHIAGFLLVPTPGQFTTASWLILGLVYLLVFIYLISAWRSNGRRSIHDILACTEINLNTTNSFRK